MVDFGKIILLDKALREQRNIQSLLIRQGILNISKYFRDIPTGKDHVLIYQYLGVCFSDSNIGLL
jgi:hypothetical protein